MRKNCTPGSVRGAARKGGSYRGYPSGKAVATLTKSEALFADLCATRKVPCGRIAEGTTRIADYEVTLGRVLVYVEVKQLDPNEKDRKVKDQLDAGRIALTMAPTRRVRDQIAKAYNQLKSYGKRGHPCMVVLFNNAGFLSNIDSFTVTSAMFGSFGFRLALDGSQTIRVSGHGFLGGRKLTRNTCRGISAVCVLEANGPEGLRLTAYHNPFATNQIEPTALALLATTQLRHDDPHTGQFVPLVPGVVGV